MASTVTDRQLLTLLLAALALVVLLPGLLFGFGMMGGGHMGGWGGTWESGTAPGWWLLVALLFRALALAAVLGGGYLLYRALVGRQRGVDPAMAELRAAYARGDLTDEEYETRRERLERED